MLIVTKSTIFNKVPGINIIVQTTINILVIVVRVRRLPTYHDRYKYRATHAEESLQLPYEERGRGIKKLRPGKVLVGKRGGGGVKGMLVYVLLSYE